MRATEVFTPGKQPAVTYVDDHLVQRAQTLLNALDTGASVISISGPSKSGKTVFIEKTIGTDRLIQITGAGITEANKLWDRVFDLVGTPITSRHTSGTSVQGSVSAKASGGLNFGIKAQAEASGTAGVTATTSEQQDMTADYLQLLIRELGGTGMVVFIDDFHYIPREAQVEISNQIKEAIRNDVLFIVASVPYHSDDAIRANPDLRGRSIKLDFDYWKPEELAKIARKGFDALNLEADEAYILGIASEAAGSPQLMQSLCLNTCFTNGIREKAKTPYQLRCDMNTINDVCTQVATTSDYSSTLTKMNDGPRVRGQDRKSYLATDQKVIDVYPLILRAIALNPPELTLRYSNLQRRIQQVCVRDTPSGSSVTTACSHIASIANDAENRTVLEWDGENDVLDIRDPYLLFYLRWNE